MEGVKDLKKAKAELERKPKQETKQEQKPKHYVIQPHSLHHKTSAR